MTQFHMKTEKKNSANQTASAVLPSAALRSMFAEKLKEKFFNIAIVFRKFDENHDGFIDADEFQKAVFKLGLVLTHNERAELFTSLDIQKRGKVDYSEFSQLLDEPANLNTGELPRLHRFNLPILESKVKSKFNDSFDIELSISSPKNAPALRSKSSRPFKLVRLRGY